MFATSHFLFIAHHFNDQHRVDKHFEKIIEIASLLFSSRSVDNFKLQKQWKPRNIIISLLKYHFMFLKASVLL